MESHNFGFLDFVTEARRGHRIRRTNVFSIYRKRALGRLRELECKLVGSSVADYFYHENRCGIAHGKSRVKEYDFEFNIEELSKDAYVLKLLSRIAIEDKI